MDIRPAATLVLTRDTPHGLEVLLMQRTWDAAFLPGYFVFPGGAVDTRETEARAHAAGAADTEISHTMSLDEGGADYMLAAIRECFEESGILLACDASGALITGDHDALGHRDAVYRSDMALADVCHRHGLTIPLDRLAYLSHWITPPGPSRRFDTRFFVAVAPDGQTASHDGQETIDHAWIAPADALADHRAGRRLLGMPTIRTLRMLTDFSDTAAMMRYAHANPPEPIPSKPWPGMRGGEPVTLEPGAPAYDESVKLDPEGEGTTRAEILPGEAVEIAAGVIRLTAPNAGIMTGPGTNTYILGHDRFTVIDPGPADDLHIQRIIDFTGGRIDRVLVTHTHRDHSPGAQTLRERTGCPVAGWPAPPGIEHDQDFQPDEQPQADSAITTEAGTLKVLHTPGHACNHLCYLLTEQEILFSGDHIMQGSTVIINPPDGDMKAYIESLYGLLNEPTRFIAPAHGFLMARPEAVIDFLITHRLSREHKVARALEELSPVGLQALTARAYDDVPKAMQSIAARSALAHLLKLEAEHRAFQEQDLWHAVQPG